MHKIIFVPTYVCGKCYSPRLSVDMVVHSEVLGLSQKGKIKRIANKNDVEGYCLECGITSNDMIPCEAIIVFTLPAKEACIIVHDEIKGSPQYIIARQPVEDTNDIILFQGKPSVVKTIPDNEIISGIFTTIKEGVRAEQAIDSLFSIAGIEEFFK